MKHQTTSPKNLKFRLLIMASALVLFSALTQATETTVFSDDLEGDWTADWHTDAGTWEVGIPTSGPNEAHLGQKCAATILNGNYSEPVSSRFIRHTSFVVPAASENPRLRFWHWYSFSTSDYGKVQIKVNGTEDWIDVSPTYQHTGSGVWTYAFVDLSDYSGQTIQIAFYFYSIQYGSYSNVSSGWYIDDVTVLTGPMVFNNIEDWENGLGDWSPERGTWEVGIPSSGPNEAHSEQQCAATVLAGNYAEPVSSRLVSPAFIVPDMSDNPRLRFWHWYSFSTSDYGKVQIKVNGTEDWIDVSPTYQNTGSGAWTYAFVDLSDYSGQTIQIAFYFYSIQYGSYSNVSSGWYIDDVTVLTGPMVFNNIEDWENGLGDWSPERGTWEVGIRSSGPNEAHSEQQCAATVLAGNYAEPVSSRLVSPAFIVPDMSDNPRLRFWHWYSFSTSDYGKVQIKVNGTEDWIDVSPTYQNTGSGAWTYAFVDLSDYSGQTIQIAFYFYSIQYGSYSNVSSGWYIDDVTVLTGPMVFNNIEDWENGLGDWSPERGTWEVGNPTGGPGSAFNGQQCAATVLAGNYAEPVSSRLVSPVFIVPDASENPSLRFWHWYSFSTSDYGKVLIRVYGTEDWVEIPSAYYTNTSGSIWSNTYFSLSDYAGQMVQIAFYFYSVRYGSYSNVSSGWYIDDILIEGLPTGVEDTPKHSDACLKQNVPNPFRSSTLITYSLKEVEFVSLTVYNELGQVVRSLINQTQHPGNYTINFDADGLPDGIYFYQLNHSNGLTVTKKMIKSTN